LQALSVPIHSLAPLISPTYRSIKMKLCNICNETKPLSEFYKNPPAKDGHHKVCILCYLKRSSKSKKEYKTTKRGHMQAFKGAAAHRARKSNLPFDIDIDYLMSIATDTCPVFKTPFEWGQYNGPRHAFGPSLDRIIPELGYVKGNVVFISNLANTVKSNVTEKELYAVADWLHDARKKVLDAQT